MKYVLPPGTSGMGRHLHDGTGREHIKDLLTLDRHEWGTIHFYIAACFVSLIIIHIFLHWPWVKNYIKSKFSLTEK